MKGPTTPCPIHNATPLLPSYQTFSNTHGLQSLVLTTLRSEPWGTPCKNPGEPKELVHYMVATNSILLKSTDEYRGMLSTLDVAGLITAPSHGRYPPIPVGYYTLYLAHLRYPPHLYRKPHQVTPDLWTSRAYAIFTHHDAFFEVALPPCDFHAPTLEDALAFTDTHNTKQFAKCTQ